MFIKKFKKKPNVSFSFKVLKILTTTRSSPDTKTSNVNPPIVSLQHKTSEFHPGCPTSFLMRMKHK